MYPGRPFKIVNGDSFPSTKFRDAGFWCGLQPYFSCTISLYWRLSIGAVARSVFEKYSLIAAS